MIVSFLNQGTEDTFNGIDSKDARKTCPRNLWSVARRKLDQINASVELNGLRSPPGNHFEQLKGDRKGQHIESIKIIESVLNGQKKGLLT